MFGAPPFGARGRSLRHDDGHAACRSRVWLDLKQRRAGWRAAGACSGAAECRCWPHGRVRFVFKRVGDLAGAARRFAEAQGLSGEARFAAELELDAKRALGGALHELEKNRGGW